jgi:threonine/homoserine/homoserine lactone efflux protein
LPAHSSATLFRMGFLTCALNPKAAMLYLSILPQFVSPAHGSVLAQSLVLGTTQIFISFSCNLVVALSAAGISGWFARKPGWMSTQRYFMGSVLGALAVRMALERRTA